MEDLSNMPNMGPLKLEFPGLGDEGLSFDFDLFPSASNDEWASQFESAGGDSGFSSPQDSPRDDWWTGFSEPMQDAPSRSRLLSLTLPNDFNVSLMPSLDKLGHVEEMALLDLSIGPMPDAPMLKLEDLTSIKLENIEHMPSLDVLLPLHNITDVHTTITSKSSDSATAPTAPSSPRQQGSIDPCVLTQCFEDDPDLEIDVVGDGSGYDFDSISAYGSPGSPTSSTAASTISPLTRENSAMSTASDFSTASTISSVSPMSTMSLSAGPLSSVSSAILPSAATTRPSSPALSLVSTPSTDAIATANSNSTTASLSATAAAASLARAANASAAANSANSAAAAGLASSHSLTCIPPLHAGVPGVPPLHMHIPGLPALNPQFNAHLGMGANGSKSNSSRAGGPYPKRNSERKRHLHNELERKRREDLNLTFFRLGDLLPNLKASTSQPTQVHILQGAAEHIRELKEKQSQLTSTRASLEAENQRLQERLRELQAMCMTN